MRKIWTKSVAVTATTGALVVGMAGMASASTGEHTETDVDQNEAQVDSQIDDVGDVSLNDIVNLDDILNGSLEVGDLTGDTNVLNGVDANVLNGVDADASDILTGILSGNDADVSVDPDVDTDAEASTDGSEGGDDDSGLLGLLN